MGVSSSPAQIPVILNSAYGVKSSEVITKT